MTPLEKYQAVIKQKHFQADPAQLAVMQQFQQIHQNLISHQRQREKLFYSLTRLFNKPSDVKGLYLWGGVGRGKTWMMDLFYETLPFSNKYRTHFHRFIRQIHEQLEKVNGQKNPLKLVARDFAKNYQLLCLDEFHVSDITDAMILYGLLKSLVENNVTIVMTSNLIPDDLYKDGLQRERFIPAIELIKHVCTVHKIDDGIDHRLNTLQAESIYFTPLNATSQKLLSEQFSRLVPCEPKHDTDLVVNHRKLPVHQYADDVAWFIFDDIFNSPRAVADYIELARLFSTVIISDIPYLNSSNEDKTQRFIQLMDEFYDRNVKVLISAVDSAEKLYQGKILQFEFERTVSRIEEMKSLQYMKKPHKP